MFSITSDKPKAEGPIEVNTIRFGCIYGTKYLTLHDTRDVFGPHNSLYEYYDGRIAFPIDVGTATELILGLAKEFEISLGGLM